VFPLAQTHPASRKQSHRRAALAAALATLALAFLPASATAADLPIVGHGGPGVMINLRLDLFGLGTVTAGQSGLGVCAYFIPGEPGFTLETTDGVKLGVPAVGPDGGGPSAYPPLPNGLGYGEERVEKSSACGMPR
jgi:hypothetical protein